MAGRLVLRDRNRFQFGYRSVTNPAETSPPLNKDFAP